MAQFRVEVDAVESTDLTGENLVNISNQRTR